MKMESRMYGTVVLTPHDGAIGRENADRFVKSMHDTGWEGEHRVSGIQLVLDRFPLGSTEQLAAKLRILGTMASVTIRDIYRTEKMTEQE